MSYLPPLSDADKARALGNPPPKVTTTSSINDPKPLLCDICGTAATLLVGKANEKRCPDCDLNDRKAPPPYDHPRIRDED